MIATGHNENAVRLAALAGDAQIALDRVAKGETDAIEGWLEYGAALNEGRALFPGDREFSAWMSEWQVAIQVEAHERAAAMWAAANRDQFDEARAAGKARTVRGIHAKWKEIEAAREAEAKAAERKAEQDRKRAEAEEAKKEAEAKAEAARAAAAAAKTEEDKAEAEARAAEAEQEKAAAEAMEDEANATVEAEEDAEKAALRKEFRKLTKEAQEEDFIGLHLSIREKDRTIAAQKAELDRFKAWWAATIDGSNIGRALGNAERQKETAEGRMKEYQATAVRLDRRVKALEAENKKLRAEIENTMIPLGP